MQSIDRQTTNRRTTVTPAAHAPRVNNILLIIHVAIASSIIVQASQHHRTHLGVDRDHTHWLWPSPEAVNIIGLIWAILIEQWCKHRPSNHPDFQWNCPNLSDFVPLIPNTDNKKSCSWDTSCSLIKGWGKRKKIYHSDCYRFPAWLNFVNIS